MSDALSMFQTDAIADDSINMSLLGSNFQMTGSSIDKSHSKPQPGTSMEFPDLPSLGKDKPNPFAQKLCKATKIRFNGILRSVLGKCFAVVVDKHEIILNRWNS
jgi:hypothetical protein